MLKIINYSTYRKMPSIEDNNGVQLENENSRIESRT